MNLGKLIKSPSNEMFGVILLVGLVILTVILMNYNSSKGTKHEKMTQNATYADASMVSQPSSVDPSSGPSNFLEVSGIQSATPPASNQNNLNPSDLLPKDVHSEWSDLNPASNDLKNLNLLSADQMIGINTVSSSLRNANYQERSEPAIPKVDLGPWWHSTIEPDKYRRPLEIGTV
jgi:hypothetical protein